MVKLGAPGCWSGLRIRLTEEIDGVGDGWDEDGFGWVFWLVMIGGMDSLDLGGGRKKVEEGQGGVAGDSSPIRDCVGSSRRVYHYSSVLRERIL